MPDQNKPISAAVQKRLRKWFKDKGHRPERVDDMAFDTSEHLVETILDLHGVKPAEYAAARH